MDVLCRFWVQWGKGQGHSDCDKAALEVRAFPFLQTLLFQSICLSVLCIYMLLKYYSISPIEFENIVCGSVLGQDTSEPSLVLVKPRKA